MTAWISPADIEAWLHSDRMDGETAQILADAATDAVKTFLQRDLEYGEFTEYYDGNNTDYILLNQWPVRSITSVSIWGWPAPILPARPGNSGYRLDSVNPRKLQFIGYGKIWRTPAVITVSYNAGYDLGQLPSTATGLPSDIYMALKLTASAIFNSAATDPNLLGESVGGVFSGSYHQGGPGSIPPGAQSLLQPYRRISP